MHSSIEIGIRVKDADVVGPGRSRRSKGNLVELLKRLWLVSGCQAMHRIVLKMLQGGWQVLSNVVEFAGGSCSAIDAPMRWLDSLYVGWK